MKQEQVIELARKAGFHFYDMKDVGCGESVEADSFDAASRFAKLVEQATLERAAREAKQAELKMPEPVAKIEGGSLQWHIPNDSYSVKITLLQGVQHLYTEQQLRTLLAQHGIKIAD